MVVADSKIDRRARNHSSRKNFFHHRGFGVMASIKSPASKVLLIFTALFFLSTGIAAGGSMLKVTKAENGKTLTIHKNDLLQIELESMGAAGYAWHIESLDPTYLEVISPGGSCDSKGNQRVGGPVTCTWEFRSLKEGETEIVMLNFRPWEAKSRAAEEFRIKLKILAE
jgi:predicted secreted protein